jgi:hypothetical protein
MSTDDFLPSWVASQLATCDPTLLAERILLDVGGAYKFDPAGLAIGRADPATGRFQLLAHVPSRN